MRAYERFLNYVRIPTQSDDKSSSVPTTKRQFVLADLLAEELRAMGVQNIVRDETCYVYGTLPATAGYESAPSIGFIAHMDTSPDFSGEGVFPVITENYNGADLPLGNSGHVLRVADFPHLKNEKGKTLITTDGTTLLGADDKAGIAEIMTFLEMMITEGIPHGRIAVCFTPDEEVGAGADHFDLSRFGADFAYTVDGGAVDCIEYENFNASSATVECVGVNVHPGEAKDIMINASLIAMEFNSLLPREEIPAKTEGYEGFYHLTDMEGSCEKSTLHYIIRDHDEQKHAARCALLHTVSRTLNERLGGEFVRVSVKEQYRNMLEKIRPHMHLIDIAKDAIKSVGLTPKEVAIRGGTDGARLSFMGLPCPNLGTGGYGFHGPLEHITAESMDDAVAVITAIATAYKDTRFECV